MQTAFESDMYEEDTDTLVESGESGFEDGFEEDGMDEGDDFEDEGMEAEGFEEDGFEEDGMDEDGFEEGADELEAGEAWGEDGLDEYAEEGEGDDALEEAFAEAMAAGDEDEFLGRLRRAFGRIRRVAGPALRRVARRALPIGMRLLRQGASQIGGVARQELGGALQGVLGGLLGGANQVDAMDAFADAAAEEAGSAEEMDEFVPVLGGLAGRYAVRAVTSAAARRRNPAVARSLGRAVTRATTQAARTIVRRQGPAAVRSVPRLVRRVTVMVRRQGASPRAIPRMIRRSAARVAASPRAAARLSRPSPAARRLRARAGVRPGAALRRPVGAAGAMRRMRPRGARLVRSIVIRGPARISVRRLT